MRTKKKIFTLAISLMVLAGCCICFMWGKAMIAPDKPIFSISGGMYDEALLLELSVNWGHDIYYTVDGSTPTCQSKKYEKPIRVTDRSQEENVFRNKRNVVKDWLEYEPDTTLVKKGTVIRAMSVSKWGNSSEVITETYFVGQENLNEGDTYILSIVADPEELFGDYGICVTGKEYDEWYLSGKPQMLQSPETNFSKKIEVIGNLEIFEGEKRVLNQLIGMRVRGFGSRECALKYFNLFSRNEYSGSNIFETTLYENVKTHSVMLKPLSIYVTASDILLDRDVATQKSKKVKVFLNGEFWYDTYMLERYDQEYFKEYYGVKDTAIIKEKTSITCKNYTTQVEFERLMEWIQNADFTQDEQWEILNEKVDIQSYIDYLAANIYLCNVDFCVDHNYRRWFSENNGNEPYEDGRMRWSIYDLDFIGTADWNSFSDEYYGGSRAVNKNPFYQAFYVNEEYRRQFVLSFMDMANNNFAPENMEPILRKYGMDLSWNDNFFLKRYDYVTAYLSEEFKLSGVLEPVEIAINDEEGGSIIVNTSTIKFSDGVWDGKYYTDYPITIMAKPNDGYRFVGWEGDIEQTDGVIEVSVEGGLKFKAVFEKGWKLK